MKEETYRLIVIGKTGMYTTGDHATTPALARLVPGCLVRTSCRETTPSRLGVERVTWRHDRDGEPSVYRKILIDAEDVPGQWAIGPEQN